MKSNVNTFILTMETSLFFLIVFIIQLAVL